jgi:NAD(P)H dehydrogenase (quinone)
MAQNTITRFLIAGAGGRHGATGNHVVRQLLGRRLPVRAFVFHADQRSEQLAELGAEVVVGDLRDIEAVRRAMRGITRAYFVYPLAEGLLEALTVFAVSPKETGVECIVNMSQITARADFPSQAARQYWLGERVLDWSGIGVIHLEPTIFMENLLVYADAIRNQSKIFLPYGHGKSAPVCAEDVARVIVGVLVDPALQRRQDVHSYGATLSQHDGDGGDLRARARQADRVRRPADSSLDAGHGEVSDDAIPDRISISCGGSTPARRARRTDRHRPANWGGTSEAARRVRRRKPRGVSRRLRWRTRRVRSF